MSFKKLMNDKITLIKQDGDKYEDVKANVQSNKIFISDATLPVEEGDKIKRELPNGLPEEYLVKERGFKKGRGGILDHYQCEVEKVNGKNELAVGKKVIYNLLGDNSRININSKDDSINIKNVSSDELFEKLIKVVKEEINENNEEILKTINEMKENKNRKSFVEGYAKFISSVSDHIEVVKPFLPALIEFL